MSNIERKVDVMFDIIQNYQPPNTNNNQADTEIGETNMNNESNELNQFNKEAWNHNSNDNINLDRITISEDEGDDDDDDDSEEVSDTDSEDDDENIQKLSLDKTEDMSLSVSDVKKITYKETKLLQITMFN